ncbi:ubiquitin carboxyl-terminal hydrolase, putative [Plasmodium berghei]|uniref:Ubiquitin carboxyl-terminal hydrolase, putative n=1 Tax=Plasmodium berghei TaxID=5821 RepID=A0A1C6WN78_PLABE|nr:ubiquitin carboxyl-terminal hydrolase, putative [Plasmodium berghei]SCM15257.1 ubiquitin carboxyl-terminal hydrolase, putative [Plasmodium berghei]SCM17052.1 ubiquitin carboxyl-terminal hydrolase, putative [Plasmodium berghei]SCN21937.1 ubiquitin carboxyl-terminal hydrolase, putative [Plasmodium berghei]
MINNNDGNEENYRSRGDNSSDSDDENIENDQINNYSNYNNFNKFHEQNMNPCNIDEIYVDDNYDQNNIFKQNNNHIRNVSNVSNVSSISNATTNHNSSHDGIGEIEGQHSYVANSQNIFLEKKQTENNFEINKNVNFNESYSYKNLRGVAENEIELIVDNFFDKIESNDEIYSEWKVCPNFIFRILFIPKTKSNNYIYPVSSAFIETMSKDDWVNDWGFSNVQYYIILINQVDYRHSFYKIDNFNFSHINTDRGWHNFIPFDKIKEPGFINKKGEIILRAGVFPFGSESYKNSRDVNYNSKIRTGFVGLKNHGATCYMNALLQLLYHINIFRKSVCMMIFNIENIIGSKTLEFFKNKLEKKKRKKQRNKFKHITEIDKKSKYKNKENNFEKTDKTSLKRENLKAYQVWKHRKKKIKKKYEENIKSDENNQTTSSISYNNIKNETNISINSVYNDISISTKNQYNNISGNDNSIQISDIKNTNIYGYENSRDDNNEKGKENEHPSDYILDKINYINNANNNISKSLDSEFILKKNENIKEEDKITNNNYTEYEMKNKKKKKIKNKKILKCSNEIKENNDSENESMSVSHICSSDNLSSKSNASKNKNKNKYIINSHENNKKENYSSMNNSNNDKNQHMNNDHIQTSCGGSYEHTVDNISDKSDIENKIPKRNSLIKNNEEKPKNYYDVSSYCDSYSDDNFSSLSIESSYTTSYVSCSESSGSCFYKRKRRKKKTGNTNIDGNYYENERTKEIDYKNILIEEENEKKNILPTSLALQNLFYKLHTQNEAVSCKELIRSFGWNANDVFTQQDTHELLKLLLDKVEEQMKGTVVDGSVKKMFEGEVETYIECIDIDYKSVRKETYEDIQLDVHGCNNIYESLDKAIEAEILEGDNIYETDGYGMQRAKKGMRFLNFPNICIFLLKRFTFDLNKMETVKLNNKFEFYKELDLSKYCKDTEQQYTLQAVSVHQGNMNSGHYYSFSYKHDEKFWLKCDDDKIYRVSEHSVINDNFGGYDIEIENNMYNFDICDKIKQRMKNYSAYMLVYVKKSLIPKLIKECDPALVNPQVVKRCKLEEIINKHRTKLKQNILQYVKIKVYDKYSYIYKSFSGLPSNNIQSLFHTKFNKNKTLSDIFFQIFKIIKNIYTRKKQKQLMYYSKIHHKSNKKQKITSSHSMINKLSNYSHLDQTNNNLTCQNKQTIMNNHNDSIIISPEVNTNYHMQNEMIMDNGNNNLNNNNQTYIKMEKVDEKRYNNINCHDINNNYNSKNNDLMMKTQFSKIGNVQTKENFDDISENSNNQSDTSISTKSSVPSGCTTTTLDNYIKYISKKQKFKTEKKKSKNSKIKHKKATKKKNKIIKKNEKITKRPKKEKNMQNQQNNYSHYSRFKSNSSYDSEDTASNSFSSDDSSHISHSDNFSDSGNISTNTASNTTTTSPPVSSSSSSSFASTSSSSQFSSYCYSNKRNCFFVLIPTNDTYRYLPLDLKNNGKLYLYELLKKTNREPNDLFPTIDILYLPYNKRTAISASRSSKNKNILLFLKYFDIYAEENINDTSLLCLDVIHCDINLKPKHLETRMINKVLKAMNKQFIIKHNYNILKEYIQNINNNDLCSDESTNFKIFVEYKNKCNLIKQKKTIAHNKIITSDLLIFNFISNYDLEKKKKYIFSLGNKKQDLYITKENISSYDLFLNANILSKIFYRKKKLIQKNSINTHYIICNRNGIFYKIQDNDNVNEINNIAITHQDQKQENILYSDSNNLCQNINNNYFDNINNLGNEIDLNHSGLKKHDSNSKKFNSNKNQYLDKINKNENMLHQNSIQCKDNNKDEIITNSKLNYSSNRQNQISNFSEISKSAQNHDSINFNILNNNSNNKHDNLNDHEINNLYLCLKKYTKNSEQSHIFYEYSLIDQNLADKLDQFIIINNRYILKEKKKYSINPEYILHNTQNIFSLESKDICRDYQYPFYSPHSSDLSSIEFETLDCNNEMATSPEGALKKKKKKKKKNYAQNTKQNNADISDETSQLPNNINYFDSNLCFPKIEKNIINITNLGSHTIKKAHCYYYNSRKNDDIIDPLENLNESNISAALMSNENGASNELIDVNYSDISSRSSANSVLTYTSESTDYYLDIIEEELAESVYTSKIYDHKKEAKRAQNNSKKKKTKNFNNIKNQDEEYTHNNIYNKKTNLSLSEYDHVISKSELIPSTYNNVETTNDSIYNMESHLDNIHYEKSIQIKSIDNAPKINDKIDDSNNIGINLISNNTTLHIDTDSIKDITHSYNNAILEMKNGTNDMNDDDKPTTQHIDIDQNFKNNNLSKKANRIIKKCGGIPSKEEPILPFYVICDYLDFVERKMYVNRFRFKLYDPIYQLGKYRNCSGVILKSDLKKSCLNYIDSHFLFLKKELCKIDLDIDIRCPTKQIFKHVCYKMNIDPTHILIYPYPPLNSPINFIPYNIDSFTCPPEHENDSYHQYSDNMNCNDPNYTDENTNSASGQISFETLIKQRTMELEHNSLTEQKTFCLSLLPFHYKYFTRLYPHDSPKYFHYVIQLFNSHVQSISAFTGHIKLKRAKKKHTIGNGNDLKSNNYYNLDAESVDSTSSSDNSSSTFANNEYDSNDYTTVQDLIDKIKLEMNPYLKKRGINPKHKFRLLFTFGPKIKYLNSNEQLIHLDFVKTNHIKNIYVTPLRMEPDFTDQQKQMLEANQLKIIHVFNQTPSKEVFGYSFDVLVEPNDTMLEIKNKIRKRTILPKYIFDKITFFEYENGQRIWRSNDDIINWNNKQYAIIIGEHHAPSQSKPQIGMKIA